MRSTENLQNSKEEINATIHAANVKFDDASTLHAVIWTMLACALNSIDVRSQQNKADLEKSELKIQFNNYRRNIINSVPNPMIFVSLMSSCQNGFFGLMSGRSRFGNPV